VFDKLEKCSTPIHVGLYRSKSTLMYQNTTDRTSLPVNVLSRKTAESQSVLSACGQ